MEHPLTAKIPRLVVLAAGQGTNLLALLQAIEQGRLHAQVVLVVSHRADAPALDHAQLRGIQTAVRTLAEVKSAGQNRDDLDAWLAQTVLAAEPDLVLCLGWMLILGEKFLLPMQVPGLNLHPALPGQLPGKDAIAAAWQAFQQGQIHETGVMLHEVVAELDAGKPIAWVRMPLLAGESLEALRTRMREAEHALVVAGVKTRLMR